MGNVNCIVVTGLNGLGKAGLIENTFENGGVLMDRDGSKIKETTLTS
jgi:hypothetical protein